jgi:hypothetical protein
MKWFFLVILCQILFSLPSYGDPLQVMRVDYRPSAESPSCGLLRQRALEREKVLRELKILMADRLTGENQSLLLMNTLLGNKFFLAPEVWQDESVEVDLYAFVPKALEERLRSDGLESIFLSLKGPGVFWKSLVGQFPWVEYLPEKKLLHLKYFIYQNTFCGEESLPPVSLEWVASN